MNTCRETGDHGPWNSWNRIPYLTEVRNGPGKPSILPAEIRIHHNLIIGNYASRCCIDTDDGSAYIRVSNNVLAYASLRPIWLLSGSLNAVGTHNVYGRIYMPMVCTSTLSP